MLVEKRAPDPKGIRRAESLRHGAFMEKKKLARRTA